MKISKQLNKLKNLNVKAEKCSTREEAKKIINKANNCLLYTSPSPRDLAVSRMPSSA